MKYMIYLEKYEACYEPAHFRILSTEHWFYFGSEAVSELHPEVITFQIIIYADNTIYYSLNRKSV